MIAGRISGSESDGEHVKVPLKADVRGLAQFTYTVDEALSVLGWGSIQWKVIAYSALVWAFTGIVYVWLPMFASFSYCTFNTEPWQYVLVGNAYFVGRPVSSALMGMMSDRFGQKLTILLSTTYSLYFHLLASIAPSFWWLVFLVLMIGFSNGCMIGLSLSYVSEFQPPSYRRVIGTALQAASFSGGALSILFALGAYAANFSWRAGCAVAAVLLLPMFALYKCIPESPHFYISRRKLDEAEEILQQLAECNGMKLPPGRLVQSQNIVGLLNQQKREEGSWYLLVCPPRMFLLTVFMCFIQILSTLMYFSFYFLASSLTATTDAKVHSCPPYNAIDYINMIWSLAAELPACAVSSVSVRLMRQRLVFLTNGAGFLLFFALLLLKKLTQTEVMTFFFVSRLFGSSLVHAQYAYLPDFFPSVVRGKALGLLMAICNVGGLLVPYISGVLFLQHMFTGKVVFLLISTIYTIASLLLPDVTSKPLEDSVFSS